MRATDTVEVAIVGGGIAGLVTASRLLDAGVSCTVLESQGRVGGRLLTHRSAAGGLDLGAIGTGPARRGWLRSSMSCRSRRTTTISAVMRCTT